VRWIVCPMTFGWEEEVVQEMMRTVVWEMWYALCATLFQFVLFVYEVQVFKSVIYLHIWKYSSEHMRIFLTLGIAFTKMGFSWLNFIILFITTDNFAFNNKWIQGLSKKTRKQRLLWIKSTITINRNCVIWAAGLPMLIWQEQTEADNRQP